MLAIDWGTSSLRIYRLDASGQVVDTRHCARGILQVADAAFASVLQDEAADWLDAHGTHIVMSGMIGSRQGWTEVAYVPCPASLPEIAAAMASVQWQSDMGKDYRARIAPGLSCRDDSGVNDVMRGEEVQILGVLDELGPGEHVVCLPGTHSKWANVSDDRIMSFRTYMSGEVFAVLKQHSILGRTMAGDDFDEGTFLRGVTRAADAGGMLHHLFGVRAEVLAGKLAEEQSASYLSGIIIGHELVSVAGQIRQFHLVGNSALNSVYSLAATSMKLNAIVHQDAAAPRGLFALAQHMERDK
ncbi:MAG: 2-dehydro-3-deoxygalactonokinase [Burkholderiales bacterium]|jgi:2-dehydro-3-deoxygalactonokinase